MTILFRLRIALIALPIALAASCVTPNAQHRWRQARYGAHMVPQASTLTVDQEATVAALCPAGMPAVVPGSEPGPTEYAVHRGYALQFSNDLKIPLWVCEHLTATDLEGPLTGRDSGFTPDPQIQGPHSVDADYTRSGYDRGHQAPNADQATDDVARKETFYLSNVAPQDSQNNQRIWAALESLVRAWASQCGEVWVITGGMLYDPQEESAETADGWVKYWVIGTDGVAVPTHFYKIVARRRGQAWDVLGFVLENRTYSRPYDWQSYVHPVRWIEERTGLDFLPELDPQQADAIETRANVIWTGAQACHS